MTKIKKRSISCLKDPLGSGEKVREEERAASTKGATGENGGMKKK